ncbi:hypothetical protein HMPREF1531_01457 [Propionibacterium sp. oral taxon 192 str. F0372]|uniref:cation:proton antiporter n=1 Tax=Propionibacterium sp. oral taxon 192 TaxID=671222 RepID=UPI000353B444|nr:sodium:proton antiporter [Propionibacterium sp. oral taxon 192]EPH03398.1 hypothetical protein HMPREF1531_01457 [Propionibacterium sp. oral taxon 192 str. F0372]
MHETEMLIIAGVLVIVAISWFASRLGVAAPILLTVVGAGISFVPGTPSVVLDPDLILTVVLPPLLFAAAINMPVRDFRRDLSSITILSVVLVIISAFAVGTFIYWLFPALNFAASVAIGAVVAPPDAVAATAIGKRLGLPRRLVTILEGEGLVNDATALVLLRTAVAAIAGAFSFTEAVGEFVFAVIIALVIGLGVGLLAVAVRSHLDQPVLNTLISFVVPFIAFIPAEHVHASGVLSVVIAGLVTGAMAPRRFTASARVTERTNWRTIQLLLENGVFLVMGYQVEDLLEDVHFSQDSVATTIWLGLGTVAVLLVVRVLVMIPLIHHLFILQKHSAQKAEILSDVLDGFQLDDGPLTENTARVTRRLQRRHADATFHATQGLGWRGGAVLAWSGMRGVVTLAAAQSLPWTMPHRSQLMLIALIVAIVTLVIQGGTLPFLISALGIRGTDEEKDRREMQLLRLDLAEAAGALLDSPELRQSNGHPFDPEVLRRARAARLVLANKVDREDLEALATPLMQYRELERRMLEAEQAALLDIRASRTYSSRALEAAQHQIDNAGVRLEAGRPVH